MAGRPLIAFYRRICDAYGEDRILEHVADGMAMAKIQDRLAEFANETEPGKLASFDGRVTFSRPLFYQWRDDPKHPNRAVYYARARAASAASMADDAQALLDKAQPGDIAVAREQAKIRQWLAGKYDRTTYGDAAAQVNVQVNLGAQHLDALRVRTVQPLPEPAPLPPALPTAPDFETVGEGD